MPSDKTETEQRKLANLIPFEPGQSGNPAGRPRGARSKLTEAFLNALHDDFAEHGVDVVRAVRSEKPADYLRTVAALMPKQVEGSDDPDSPPIKTSLKVTFGD
jgi:hypothetical protein